MDVKSFILGLQVGSQSAGGGGGGSGGESNFPVKEFFETGCPELTLNGVEVLRYSAINDSTIQTLSLPDLKSLNTSNAIANCTNLVNVNFYEGLTTIGTSVFSNCTKISHLTIPSTVKSIGLSAFTGCTNLKSITFLGTPETIGTTFTSVVLPVSTQRVNCPWPEGAVAGAPWGATNASIFYNYTGGES